MLGLQLWMQGLRRPRAPLPQTVHKLCCSQLMKILRAATGVQWACVMLVWNGNGFAIGNAFEGGLLISQAAGLLKHMAPTACLVSLGSDTYWDYGAPYEFFCDRWNPELKAQCAAAGVYWDTWDEI